MAVQRWTFEDPATSELVEFNVNPNKGGSPKYTKNMVYQNTSAPDGRDIIFEGRRTVEPLNFSGSLFSEDEYNFFIEWFDKRNQVYMTDDLDRTFTIYITSIQLDRIRSAMFPWKHDYTVTYVIIDQ